MAAPYAVATISTDEGSPWDGHLRIEVTQVSQNKGAFTSTVLVEGTLINDNDWNVDGNGGVERHIEGSGDYYPDGFAVHVRARDSSRFITRTFIIPHDDDGKKTVTFTVHYGITGTPTFQYGKQASVSLKLTAMDVGGWIRKGNKWTHAMPYVRYQGKWKPAVVYVRTGGVWKPCQ